MTAWNTQVAVVALFSGLLSVSGLAGCDSSEATGGASDLGPAKVLVQSCGESMSLKTQYRARQGQRLQGLVGPSFTVTGARFDCEQTSDMGLRGTELTGTLPSRVVGGADFVGSALRFVDSSGVTGEVAVTQVDVDPSDSTGETMLYTLVTYDASTGTVKNICSPDPDGRAAAIPLRGRWDASGAYVNDSSISFNCTSGVIAKCVRWGYHPWQTVQGQSLAPYHQACTRMARADYCGDGVTHTQEGTLIDMYDNLGKFTPDFGLTLFEASWTPDGAYCVARDRWLIVSKLLSSDCQAKFELSIQPSPVNPLDLCFMHRVGSPAKDALLSDRTGINIGL